MPQPRPAEAAGFWLCPKCRTPNPRASYLTRCLGCGGPATASAARDAPAPGSSTATVSPTSEVGRQRLLRASTLALTWAYAVLVLVTLALTRWLGDRWWPATALLYLPPVVFLVPLPVLALAALWTRQPRLWALQAATVLVVAWPLMGATLPVSRWWSPEPPGPRWRIMTFNTHTRQFDVPALIDLIEREDIHLVCLQETDGPFPEALDAYLADSGWRRTPDGSILSRFPIVRPPDRFRHFYGPREVWGSAATVARVRSAEGVEADVVSAHLPTLRFGLEALMSLEPGRFQEHIDLRRESVSLTLGKLLPEAEIPRLVGADLNAPGVSPLLDPLRPFFHFAFDRAGWGYGYTTKPTRLPWIRIDHVLATPQFRITRCWVGPDLGSDHLPVIAEVVPPGP